MSSATQSDDATRRCRQQRSRRPLAPIAVSLCAMALPVRQCRPTLDDSVRKPRYAGPATLRALAKTANGTGSGVGNGGPDGGDVNGDHNRALSKFISPVVAITSRSKMELPNSLCSHPGKHRRLFDGSSQGAMFITSTFWEESNW